jgi:hypothetical protein
VRTPILLFLVLFVACVCFGESFRTLIGGRLSVAPTVDGIVSESEWQSATTTNGFVERYSDRETDYSTTVYAGYDDKGMYFAFQCVDPDPLQIRAAEFRRDAGLSGDDYVRVSINTFGTFRREDFNEFSVNPRGGNNASFAGGRAAKREWQGEWQTYARVTEDGWEAEMFVPWDILQLPGEGVRTLTLNFSRWVPRVQLETFWSNLGPESRYERVGRWLDVQLPLIRLPSVVQILPYTLAGAAEGRRSFSRSGVDFRHQFGTQMTGLGTINPDFENVESSVLSIDFSRFERLARERRPFFTEGEDFFSGGGMSARIFAPQRIGQIDAGAKLFGKLDDEKSFGALVTSRFDKQNFAYARYRQTWGPNRSVTLGSSWLDGNGITNTAGFLDVFTRFGAFGISSNLTATQDSVKGSGRRFDLDLSYQMGSLFASVGWQEISAGLFPRMGFAPRTGFRGINAFSTYNRNYLNGPIRKVNITGFWRNTNRTDGPGLYLRSYDIGAEMTLSSNFKFGIGTSQSNFKGLKDHISGFSISYPANDSRQNYEISTSLGKIGSLEYRDVSLSGSYRSPGSFNIGASAQFVKIGNQNQQQHILSVGFDLSSYQSITGRGIYRDGKVNWYLAFRQSGNLGIEYYLILGDPNANEFKNRLVFKAVIPYRLNLR